MGHHRHLLTFLAISAPLFMADHASSQSVADFYRGKTIWLIVGFGAGGGYDLNARLLARFIGQYLPGNPRIVVQNMPGASSLKSVQYLDNGAPTDGTVITAFNAGLVMESLTKPNEIPIDLNNFAWIGSLSQESVSVMSGRKPESGHGRMFCRVNSSRLVKPAAVPRATSTAAS